MTTNSAYEDTLRIPNIILATQTCPGVEYRIANCLYNVNISCMNNITTIPYNNVIYTSIVRKDDVILAKDTINEAGIDFMIIRRNGSDSQCIDNGYNMYVREFETEPIYDIKTWSNTIFIPNGFSGNILLQKEILYWINGSIEIFYNPKISISEMKEEYKINALTAVSVNYGSFIVTTRKQKYYGDPLIFCGSMFGWISLCFTIKKLYCTFLGIIFNNKINFL